jgi:hypothetical protein
VVWFETLDKLPDLPRGDVALLRVLPYFYLISVVIFPVALVLAVLSPWGVPYWIWAMLAGATGVGLRTFVSQECDNQGRSPDGFFAFRSWCWLLAGGGTRQALRTIAVNRRSRIAARVV